MPTDREKLKALRTRIPGNRTALLGDVDHILATFQEPTWPEKAKHWTKAIARWIAAGCRVRDPEEQERCRMVCHKCPSKAYEPQQQMCVVCGCGVAQHIFRVMDKVAMATEVCPEGHWK